MSQVETCPWQFHMPLYVLSLFWPRELLHQHQLLLFQLLSGMKMQKQLEMCRLLRMRRHTPRVLPAPVSGVPALEGDALDETMGLLRRGSFQVQLDCKFLQLHWMEHHMLQAVLWKHLREAWTLFRCRAPT